MKLKKITALFSLSVFALTVGCNTTNNTFIPVSQNNISIESRKTFDFEKVVTDETDIAGGKKNISFITNKLNSESIAKNSDKLVFKTIQLRKGKSMAGIFNGEAVNVSGAIQYYDDKGNLKAGAFITAKLMVDGREAAKVTADKNGRWSANLDKRYQGKSVKVMFEFGNKYWTIKAKDKGYDWQGPVIENLAGDTDTGLYAPVKESENAKAAWVHDIYNRYQNFFAKEGVEIDSWWNKPIKTIWPGGNDYYSWGTVNVTEAKQWDVNGHEIGHAITDIGTNSQMGGGFHKIDECYTTNLAWSEGFASFLAGAVSLSANDPDAKFEFLVPRRSPIRLENVPEDVCKGQKNEWRVSATLWDLYDTNNDGDDTITVPFKTIWASVSRKERNIGSMQDAANSLKEIAPPSLIPGIDKSNEFNTMF